MIKLLFLIHDLGQGGAEKVLVNLVNNMDFNQFDITVMSLFDEGENRQFLSPKIKYRSCFSKMVRGNSHFMKLLSPKQLHRWLIKEEYDVEIAYLEGPCARIISGCENERTKLVSWIHIEQHTAKRAAASFRSIKEAKECYGKFHRIISVSKSVENDFKRVLGVNTRYEVLYNTNETAKIQEAAKEDVQEILFDKSTVKLVGVGKLLKNKGFDRILRIVNRLLEEGYRIHLYILGEGSERDTLERFISEHQMEEYVTLLGYQLNPYKYLSRCDLFVCASLAEGFSTAATEALILGVPVCTVEVSGMKEMLGENNEYGIVVPNDEESFYEAVKTLLDHPEKLEWYRQMAFKRGKHFRMDKTVDAVEKLMSDLL